MTTPVKPEQPARVAAREIANRVDGYAKLRDANAPEMSQDKCAELIRRAYSERDRRVVEALRDAIAAIKVFHGEPAWEIYERCAPEMQRIKAALAEMEQGL